MGCNIYVYNIRYIFCIFKKKAIYTIYITTTTTTMILLPRIIRKESKIFKREKMFYVRIKSQIS